MSDTTAFDIDPKLRAIDPTGCGCTECLVGEYRPLDQASEAEIKALFLGLLRDHTETRWTIEQEEDPAIGGFVILGGGHSVRVDQIVLPIPVEYFRITVDHRGIEQIRHDAPYLH